MSLSKFYDYCIIHNDPSQLGDRPPRAHGRAGALSEFLQLGWKIEHITPTSTSVHYIISFEKDTNAV